MKLKYIVKLSLVCGVMSTAVALSGCGSSKAVQANAVVASRSSDASNSSISSDSSGVTVSSDLVSHSAPSVSSAVVTSSKPMTGGNSTSHQAPVSQKPSTGTTKPASAAPKPASTQPASTKPASTKPASTAPAPKPVSTAPSTGSISAKYNGATYGATSQSQYSEILSYAKNVTSSSKYKASYADNKTGFEDFYGIPYSDEANMVASIIGCFQNSGSAGSHGNAYTSYTQSSSNCADDAKAIQAALNVNGISCKLVWGKNARGQSHMWTEFTINGTTYQWGNNFSKGTPSGYTVRGSGYNY